MSCIKYNTIAALGLLHQISGSSTCIRTANGQDVGIKGSIVVRFKIGPCSFTVMAYRQEEDKTGEYLEVNEIVESTEFRNWTSKKGKSIIESYLVFSPAQVTEHHCVELKDQEISQETKERFEKLKEKYPKVFSVSNQDIGCTNLVTMHVDTGDNPPYVKNLTLCLLSITTGFSKKSRHWSMRESSRRASALGPAQ